MLTVTRIKECYSLANSNICGLLPLRRIYRRFWSGRLTQRHITRIMSLHTPHPDACPPQKTALAIAGMAIVVLGVKVIKDRQDNDAENEAKDLGSKVHILT